MYTVTSSQPNKHTRTYGYTLKKGFQDDKKIVPDVLKLIVCLKGQSHEEVVCLKGQSHEEVGIMSAIGVYY